MNILIITPFYKHDRNIASVRWTNIGIRLAKKHNVIVVTQPHDDMDMNMTVEKDEDNILVARINQKTWYEKTAVKHFGGATGDDWQTSAGTDEPKQVQDDFKRKLKNKVLYASMRHKAKQYADSIIKNVIPKDMTIDVVISSACPFIEMLFGYELKKRLNCKWISDFRDLPYKVDNCNMTHIQKSTMQTVLPNADIITIGGNGARRKLLSWINLCEERVRVLTNGFSRLDYKPSESQKDNVLHITYTGSLYGGTLKSDLLFEAVQKALQKYPEFKASVDFAGGNNTSAIASAERYSLQEIIKDRGFLPRDEALKLQRQSDCLLAIIKHNNGSGFAAKLYEYVLNQKPIICIILDAKEDFPCDAESFISSLNLGIIIRDCDKSNTDILSDYLVLQYKRKNMGEQLLYEPDSERLKSYDHDNLAIQVENFCLEIMS